MRRAFTLATALALLSVLLARPARAEPWFGAWQGTTEDRYLNGDIDLEDLLARTGVGAARADGSEVRAGSWLTLGGFWRSLGAGYQDVGVLLLAGVAFDKIARGRSPVIAEGTGKAKTPPPPSSPPGAPPSPPPALPGAPPPGAAPVVRVDVTSVIETRLVITHEVARQAVLTAWRASGLGVNDARIDSMVSRARASAALPEVRVRAMRVFSDGSANGVIPIDASTYATAGSNLILEARLTWRLDQLLYASDEPGLARVRLDTQEARAKLAGKVLDALFQWQRAWLAVRSAGPGTNEATDATLRLVEAEAGLDVLTGGWFGAWLAESAGGG